MGVFPFLQLFLLACEVWFPPVFSRFACMFPIWLIPDAWTVFLVFFFLEGRLLPLSRFVSLVECRAEFGLRLGFH